MMNHLQVGFGNSHREFGSPNKNQKKENKQRDNLWIDLSQKPTNKGSFIDQLQRQLITLNKVHNERDDGDSDPKTYMIAAHSEAVSDSTKTQIVNELMSLRSKYDKALTENSSLLQKLQECQQSIQNLKTTIQQLHHQLHCQQQFKYKMHELQQQNELLKRQITQLESSRFQQKYQRRASQYRQRNTHLQEIIRNQSFQQKGNNYQFKLQSFVNHSHVGHQQQNQNFDIHWEIDFYRRKIGDYQKRIEVLEEANYNLEQEIKLNIEERLKEGYKEDIQLKMNVKELRNEINELKQLSNKAIVRNLSVPILSKKKPQPGQSPKQRKHNDRKTEYRMPSRQKQNQWKDLQEKINQLRKQNEKIHKHLHINS